VTSFEIKFEITGEMKAASNRSQTNESEPLTIQKCFLLIPFTNFNPFDDNAISPFFVIQMSKMWLLNLKAIVIGTIIRAFHIPCPHCLIFSFAF
jgi:hypothetical protein